MPLAADYPLLDVFWTMLIFFIWVAWFMLLFRIFADIFRRHDLGGGGRPSGSSSSVPPVPRRVRLPDLPGSGHGDSRRGPRAGPQAHFDDYVRTVAGGSAAEIEKAKQLLDSGAITQAEYDQIKSRALASA